MTAGSAMEPAPGVHALMYADALALTAPLQSFYWRDHHA